MTLPSPLTWAVRYARSFGILGAGQSYEHLLSYLKSKLAAWTLLQSEAAPQWVTALVDVR